jgi:hypothetical protein
VEAISSEPSEAMIEAMLSFSNTFLRKTRVDEDAMEELDLFPEENLDRWSKKLLVSNAFGFDGLANVFTARYLLDGQDVTGFLSKCRSPEEAERIAAAYENFLLTLDGIERPFQGFVQDVALIEILGRHEVIFYSSNYVAGVHDAENKVIAEKLAGMIKVELEASVGR